MMDDELELFRDFIERSINKPENCGNQQETVPLNIGEIPIANGKLSFVITKNKSSSWVEDLYDCTLLAERTRIYN